MEEVKIVKIIVAVAVLCAALNCQMVNATGHEHHKIRHFKHKIVHINDQHVNEIREAFEDYKKTVRNSVDKSFLRQLSVDDDLTQDASDYENENEIVYENRSKMLSKLQTTRHKRVDVYESTSKSYTKTDNYDEEYDDEDEKMYDAKTKSSGVKVHESMVPNRQTLTEYKMQQLGTSEGVRREFELEASKYQRVVPSDVLNSAQITKLVLENAKRTRTEGMCRWPTKKIVEMQHHANKIYTPRKYVVHQCSDDTACCGSSNKTCVAKKTQEIVLWFNVKHFPVKYDARRYESHRVQNHTECQCVYKNNNHLPGSSNALAADEMNPTNSRSHMTTTKRPSKSLPCRCTISFRAKLEIDSDHCMCVCEAGNQECKSIHDGRKSLLLRDRRCIQLKECEQPDCLHGSYLPTEGRCPNREEKKARAFNDRRSNKESGKFKGT